MPSDYLSSGTKTLINIYYCPELQFNGSMMGDNCVLLLMEIARVTMYEYECKYPEWVEWVDTCSEEYYENLAAGIPVMPVKPVMDWD